MMIEAPIVIFGCIAMLKSLTRFSFGMHHMYKTVRLRGLSKKFVEFVDKNKTTGAINL